MSDNAVTKVDKLIHFSMREVGKYRFERKNVAVDISEDRDTHRGTVSCRSLSPTRCSCAPCDAVYDRPRAEREAMPQKFLFRY